MRSKSYTRQTASTESIATRTPTSPLKPLDAKTNVSLQNLTHSSNAHLGPKQRSKYSVNRSSQTLLRPTSPSAWAAHRTPAEYALHTVFTEFVRNAEGKINDALLCTFVSGCGIEGCCYNTSVTDKNRTTRTKEPHLAGIAGLGVDPHFDKLLTSLGSIAKHRPKPVIDAVMMWHKSKSESGEQPMIRTTSDSRLPKRRKGCVRTSHERKMVSSSIVYF